MGGRRRFVAVGGVVVLAAAAVTFVAAVTWSGEEESRPLQATVLEGGASVWRGPCGERGVVEAGAAAPADLADHLGDEEEELAWVYSSGRAEDAAGVRALRDAAVAYEAADWDADAAGGYVTWAQDVGAERRDVAAGERFVLCEDDDAVTFEVAEAGCLKATFGRFTLATCGDPEWLQALDVAVAGDAGEWIAQARPSVVVAGAPDEESVERWETFGVVYRLDDTDGGNVSVSTTGEQRFTVTASGRGTRVHPLGRGGAGRAPRIGFDGDPATTERIGWGLSPEAGIHISEARFPDQTAAHVVLAQTGQAAGSLIGAPLSAEGPLLHVDPGYLHGAVRREIRRVLPEGGTVYLVGAATGEGVAEPLREDGFTVVELAGANRVSTSIAVADALLELAPGDEIALVPGWPTADDPTEGWGDVVAAVAWATAHEIPVVLTRSDRLSADVADALDRWGTERAWLLGGEEALAPSIAGAVPDPVRIAGEDRAAAAVAVAEELWDGAPGRYVVVNAFDAEGWLAALPAAGLAADFEAPVLTAQHDRVPAATRRQLGGCDPQAELLLLGGRSHLSDQVERQLDTARREGC